MKAPLVLTIIILAAGSFWGVHEHQVLTTLREKHRQVTQEAAALGVSADLSKPFTPTKATKRPREDSSRKAKDFANTLVAFAKEMKEMEKNGKQPDPDTQKRIMEMMDGMLSLNGEELKILIAEMRGRTDMDDEMRKGMIGFSIMMLAQQHPETALAIFTESSDLLDDNPDEQTRAFLRALPVGEGPAAGRPGMDQEKRGKTSGSRHTRKQSTRSSPERRRKISASRFNWPASSSCRLGKARSSPDGPVRGYSRAADRVSRRPPQTGRWHRRIKAKRTNSSK